MLRYLVTALLLVLSGLCIPCSGTAEASGNAVVRSNVVPLYSEMSTGSRVVRPLQKGEQVVVEIEIQGPEGAWCGISGQGQTDVTGYVQCKDLQRSPEKELWQYVGSTAPARAKEDREANVTQVEVVGNHVLVPATVEYRGRTLEVRLVLDTGAGVTMINTDIADQLGIEPAETVKGDGQVVGGMIIPAAFARLGHISVGPHRRRDMFVSIIEEKGLREKRDGLLGMDFLRGLKYYVDFKRQVIIWGP